jgi:hypothetical protein
MIRKYLFFIGAFLFLSLFQGGLSYSGGGDIQEIVSNKLNQSPDIAQSIVTQVGDSVGYWWILGLALLGAVYFFRKKISKFFE